MPHDVHVGLAEQRVAARAAVLATDVLFNVIAYRLFNWPPTYQALGGFRPVGAWEPEAMLAILEEMDARGLKIFPGAYHVSQRCGPADWKEYRT